MEFGAPMHKIDEQLAAACDFLSIKAHFVLFNTVIILVFEDPDGASPSQKHFIQRPQGLSLEQLQRTHAVYSAVIHDRISAAEGARQLKAIMDHPETCGVYVKILFAFLAGFAICPMGFSGSFVDSLVAGASSTFLMIVQLLRGGDVLFTGIFEYADYSILFPVQAALTPPAHRIVVAIFVSFVARMLNSIGGHIFCYSAISSSGVVLILPGFLVRTCLGFILLPRDFFVMMGPTSVQGSLELASKNFITGATKIVYAIIYSLILVSLSVGFFEPFSLKGLLMQGFSLTLGSDIAFLVNSSFRVQRDQMATDIGQTISLVGTYTSTNNTDLPLALNGTFLFNQLLLPGESLVKYHYIVEGCYRDVSWPMVFQPFAWPWLFALAPLFVLCLATLNGQGWRDWRRLLVIVAFGCCSFAANKVFNMWIYDRGDVVSAIGATVVGILGTIYGHYSEGDALPSMIPGILVLLPVKSNSAHPVS